MDWFLSVLNVLLVVGFYEGVHGYLYFSSKGLRKEGKISLRVLNKGEENAVTLNSLFFRNTIIFLSNKIDERILRHEEGHIKQFNYVYALMVAVAALLPFTNAILIPAVILGKFLWWKAERDADLYAYYNYNVKYESDAERPKSRVERLKAWLLDSHPPDYVRKEEEYYEKKNNLVKLFVHDLLS
jgi:hypothetical protein